MTSHISICASSYPLFSSGIDASTKPIVTVKITPTATNDSTQSRRPFHLAMLLDVSGSMDGERIDALCRTLHLLVDALSEHDVLTLIKYNNVANVCADCVSITKDTRSVLHATIDEFVAEGGTNMEAAIQALFKLTTDSTKPNVDAVFILTDGHINAGMSSSAGLLRLLQNQIHQGVPINTLGYGAEHNSRLLRDLALRSHGSYTFADAAEVLPAIIGDIMGGLESEVGRQAKLIIPEGWKCLELQTLQSGSYCIGTLISEKSQWIVLEGEPGVTSIPSLTCTWVDSSSPHVEHSVTCNVDTSISMLEIIEQRERCRVANVFSQVTEDIEKYLFDVARTKLDELARELAASPAKDTVFVIRLQAQVDDMIESLKNMNMPPAVGAGRLSRTRAGAGVGMGVEGGFALGSVISRLASGTTVLVNQRGIMPTGSGVSSVGGAGGAGGGGAGVALFSSPSQRNATTRLTNAYSGISGIGNEDGFGVDTIQ
jgi:Mg-chelatase subunit ChlD